MVQSYRIHLILGTVLDKDRNETAMQLASPDENGIYQGFMGVNGWTNWWFREANNVLWGNLGKEGMTFHASSAADDHWNFWFPDPSGCYFTTVNTVESWWSALHIDNLSVAGDLTGEMTYNQRNNQWTLPISLPSASTVSITVTGHGRLYNKETTDMGPAVEKNVAFSGNSRNLVFGENGSTITLNLPAGETNLLLDLSNPLELTIAAGDIRMNPLLKQNLTCIFPESWIGMALMTTYPYTMNQPSAMEVPTGLLQNGVIGHIPRLNGM